MKTPVLFLVFNRPDLTERVFSQIRRARPPRLYVACDGPRRDFLEDDEKVSLVRDIATSVDWTCSVQTLFREDNLGCRLAVSSGINWFFEQEEEGIILEDDCVPTDSFFPFMEELLGRYRFERRIFHIDGSSFIPNRGVFTHDYSFSNYALIWGWATWRRAWSHYDINMKNLDILESSGYLRSMFGAIYEQYWIDNLRKAKAGFDTWDYQWFYTLWSNGGLAIRPSRSMVQNIGFRGDATHTKTEASKYSLLQPSEYDFPLRHPKALIPNFYIDRITSKARFPVNRRIVLRSVISKLMKMNA